MCSINQELSFRLWRNLFAKIFSMGLSVISQLSLVYTIRNCHSDSGGIYSLNSFPSVYRSLVISQLSLVYTIKNCHSDSGGIYSLNSFPSVYRSLVISQLSLVNTIRNCHSDFGGIYSLTQHNK